LKSITLVVLFEFRNSLLKVRHFAAELLDRFPQLFSFAGISLGFHIWMSL
jgi:hypothetical protein